MSLDSKLCQVGGNDQGRVGPAGALPPGLEAGSEAVGKRRLSQQFLCGLQIPLPFKREVFQAFPGSWVLESPGRGRNPAKGFLVDVLLKNVAQNVRINFVVLGKRPCIEVPGILIEEGKQSFEGFVRKMLCQIIPKF